MTLRFHGDDGDTRVSVLGGGQAGGLSVCPSTCVQTGALWDVTHVLFSVFSLHFEIQTHYTHPRSMCMSKKKYFKKRHTLLYKRTTSHDGQKTRWPSERYKSFSIS